MKKIALIILISMIGLNAQDIFAQTDIKKFPATSQAITIVIESDSIAVFGMFAAGEERELNVRFYVDPELPAHIDNITLSYTLFEKQQVASNQ